MSKNKVHDATKYDEVVVLESDEKKIKMNNVWDCGSPLYDSYELASVSHLIERHLMILPSLGGSKRFKLHDHHGNHQHQKIINHGRESTAVIASMVAMDNNASRSNREYMVLSRVIGCMGNYSLLRKMRGGRIMKIKFKKFRPSGIKCFM